MVAFDTAAESQFTFTTYLPTTYCAKGQKRGVRSQRDSYEYNNRISLLSDSDKSDVAPDV